MLTEIPEISAGNVRVHTRDLVAIGQVGELVWCTWNDREGQQQHGYVDCRLLGEVGNRGCPA